MRGRASVEPCRANNILQRRSARVLSIDVPSARAVSHFLTSSPATRSDPPYTYPVARAPIRMPPIRSRRPPTPIRSDPRASHAPPTIVSSSDPRAHPGPHLRCACHPGPAGLQLRSACHPSSPARSLFPGENPKTHCLRENITKKSLVLAAGLPKPSVPQSERGWLMT